jgi:hypothetical protein
MLLLTRRPLRTTNWQIFSLTFWNTRPTHLIWPLQTTTSLLTSMEESFRALRRPYRLWRVVCSTTERIFLGWVKEIRTTKS